MSNVAKRAGMLRSHLHRKMWALGIPAARHMGQKVAKAPEELHMCNSSGASSRFGYREFPQERYAR